MRQFVATFLAPTSQAGATDKGSQSEPVPEGELAPQPIPWA